MSSDEVRPYKKRSNPHSYKSKEYFSWYYYNVIKPKKAGKKK